MTALQRMVTLALDVAHKVQRPGVACAPSARTLEQRLLALAALLQGQLVPPTTAFEALGFGAGKSIDDRLVRHGVTPAHVSAAVEHLFALDVTPIEAARAADAWPDGRVTQLKQLVAEGLSASDIAKRLGVTRGAVTGKVKRLKLRLLGRRGEWARPRSEKVNRTPRPARQEPEDAPPPAADDEGRPLTARPWESRSDSECAWPFTVEGETWSCCGPAVAGKWQYCRYHLQKLWADPSEREARPKPSHRVPVMFARMGA